MLPLWIPPLLMAVFVPLIYGLMHLPSQGEGHIISSAEQLVLGSCALTLLFGMYMIRRVLSHESGNEAMRAVASAIQEGARAYLNRQYKTIGIVGIVVAGALGFFLGPVVSGAFVVGAVLSGVAGYIGMHISVRANVRTAEAARQGLSQALAVAVEAGSITGVLVAGLALFGVALCLFGLLWAGYPLRVILEALIALSFGASLISLFARLGGGIFTKGADVGADLVGKIEAGIPEDDPRNPAVIADNVGDNVGDCAGMAADLFETYVVTLVATCEIAAFVGSKLDYQLMLYPLVVAAVCGFGSLLGLFFIRLMRGFGVMAALYRGLIAAVVLSGGALWFATKNFLKSAVETPAFAPSSLFACAAVGLVVTVLLVMITEFYTSTRFRPVRRVAEASTTGHATNIIEGLAVSMESCALPVLVICGAILVTYSYAGLYGVGIAATAMLGLAGMIVTLDAYGPITDNAGGIAEMAGLPERVRRVTDTLDAVGNTTKAVTKGYAIGSAGLAALVLFGAYIADLKHYFPDIMVEFHLNDPYVLVGLFVGGLLPYLFSAMGMTAVGRAGAEVVREVRRQFKANPGIMTGEVKPDYAKTVDMLMREAIRQMVLPSLLPVAAPFLLYGVICYTGGMRVALSSVGGMLLGAILTGLFLGISMTSGGGAWDNAKKYIEDGVFGGKGSEAHKAAVTGDTVGDPYKDTAGPAINPMIKLINIVALLLLMIVSAMA